MFAPPFAVNAQLPVDFDHLVYQHDGKLLPFVKLGENRGFWTIAYDQGKELLERMASGHLDQDVVFTEHKSEQTGGDGRIAMQKTYVLRDETRLRTLSIHASRKIKIPGRFAEGLYVATHKDIINRLHDVNLQRLQYGEAMSEVLGLD